MFEAKDNDCQSCISRSFSILLFATDLTNTIVTVGECCKSTGPGDHFQSPMYKIHDSALPYLSDLPFGVRCRSSSPRIDCTDVCCAVHQDAAGDRSFDVMGPHIWNKLPASVHLMEDLGYFRRLLKARIFRSMLWHLVFFLLFSACYK